MVFTGDCSTNYMELESKLHVSFFLSWGKYCSANYTELHTAGESGHNQVRILFLGSPKSSFDVTWTTKDIPPYTQSPTDPTWETGDWGN